MYSFTLKTTEIQKQWNEKINLNEQAMFSKEFGLLHIQFIPKNIIILFAMPTFL